MKKKTVTQFVDTEWKSFFDHVSQSKNAFLPYEGLLEVERKVIYAAKILHLNMNHEELTRRLASDTGLYHISGEASVQDTIKSMASSYKRQHEVMILKGVGAFPTSLSNTGAAARYTHILATPLLMKIMEDINFCPYFIDDSGIEQPMYIVPPMPLGAIRTMKNIGIGKSCFILERPHDEVFKWAREIIDEAYPGNSSGFAEEFYNEIKDSGIISEEEIRNYGCNAKHSKISKETMSKIYSINPPDPFMHTGCNVTYDRDKKVVWMEAKIEKVKEDGKTRFYITDLPLEISDTTVITKMQKKFGSSILDKLVDRSGEGHPIYLEIPRSIYNDPDSWSSLGLKKAFIEQYVMWNEELNAPTIYKHLHNIIIEWYKKREEVVAKKLYHKIAVSLKKKQQNNLIERYYNDTVVSGGKTLKSEKEVIAKYGEEDGKFLYNLPQKTYLPENIDSIKKKNEELDASIAEIEKSIKDIKNFIFSEWSNVASQNKEFFKGEI